MQFLRKNKAGFYTNPICYFNKCNREDMRNQYGKMWINKTNFGKYPSISQVK